MSATAIILAAGQSKRMKSALPKPLHDVCGKPMLDHIFTACFEAGCTQLIVVVGHGKEQVIARFSDDKRIHFVEQTERLGTGHAVRVCEPELKKLSGSSDVFVLAGDGPLIRGEVLRTLRQAMHDDKAHAALATAVIDDATGYGRIVRDDNGDFVSIVEHADATPEQREIREIFPSYYVFRAEDLLLGVSKLKPNNKQGEFYLTDAYALLRGEGRKVVAVQAVPAEDVLSVNTRQQLADVDMLLQDRIHRLHREAGVTIVSSASTYVEAGCSIGPDTVIQPFSYVGRDSSIGSNCVIGPFACVPRESVVPDGTHLAGNVRQETAMLNQSSR